MFHTIKNGQDGLHAVETGRTGKPTGVEFVVPHNVPGGARACIEELIGLRETAVPVMRQMSDILEDVGFGRLTPGAITSNLLRSPEELASTVEALHHVYPDIKKVIETPAGLGEDESPSTPPWEKFQTSMRSLLA